jgi:acyl dehydratase
MIAVKSTPILKIGQTYRHESTFSQANVIAFCKISGDNNPLHLDEAFAATTPFKRTILPGMLSASLFSKVLGTLFPGKGTIYLKQSLIFLKPMFVDTNYVAEFTVKTLEKDKNKAIIETIIRQKEGEDLICISGEAMIMNLAMIKQQQ